MTTPGSGRSFTRPSIPDALAALLTLAFLAVLIRTAWMSDDAMITLRTVLNVTHGFGLRYNIAERVQTFTHPLWLAVITAAYAVTFNVYFAAFLSSVLLSVLAFWLAITRAASAWQAAAVVVVLFFSRAFVDFSTSGLENPLAYVLLAALVFGSMRLETGAGDARRGLTRLWLIGSLLYLTRPDAILLAAPLLIVLTWRSRHIAGLAVPVRPVVIGLLPAIGWTIFAIVYYGFPFPNTAYAKLAMGISRSELWTQGVLYLFDSIDRDPITLTTIGFGVALAALDRRPVISALAAGLVLYVLYVISIGGDFMAGRFVAAPVFAAALLVGTLARARRTVWSIATLALLAVGCTAPHLPLWSNSGFDDSANKPSGIIDERGVYFKEHSLVRARRATFREPDWPSAKRPIPPPRVLPTCGLMGAAGLGFGPYVHLMDECALADPLLARLPAVYSPEWRAGHYRRQIPPGYPETLASGTNQLTDPGLHEFYNHLSEITRAPHLFSAARWRAIVAMNTGRYDGLVDRTYFRYGGSVASLRELGAKRQDGTPASAPGVKAFTQALAITTGGSHAEHVSISLDSDDRYLLSFMRNGALMGTVELGPIPQYRRTPGLVDYETDVPSRAAAGGFDVVLIAPQGGDGHYAVGHVILN